MYFAKWYGRWYDAGQMSKEMELEELGNLEALGVPCSAVTNLQWRRSQPNTGNLCLHLVSGSAVI